MFHSCRNLLCDLRARLADFYQSAPDLRQLPHTITSQKSNVFGPSEGKTLDTAPYPGTECCAAALACNQKHFILMASPNQLAANCANAQLSRGPTSSEGKAKVSSAPGDLQPVVRASRLAALKTGLTGRTVLLPSDDVTVYQAHVDRVFKQFSPEGDEEKRLTHSLADTLWRLERIPSLEAGIYAVGRRELAAEFADEEDETVRKAMIEAQVFLTYRRDLNNLSIQEARLRRQYEKDEAELKRRIGEREQVAKNQDAEEHRRWQNAIQNYRAAKLLEMPFDPAEIGFEFSIEEIVAREQQQLLKGAIAQGRYYEFKKKGWLQLPDKAA